MVWTYTVLATIIVSLVSFIGALTLFFTAERLQKLFILLVGLSAGSLLGGAFLHLIPEAVEEIDNEAIWLFVLGGFVIFFILERLLHWHHSHNHDDDGQCHRRPATYTYMNLVGDGLHNLIDGILIAASFSVSLELGIATTIAVIVHEIPQEMSDFGVLVHGGFSKGKALLYNFFSALVAIVGAIIGLLVFEQLESALPYALMVMAGGFIYIAASDLIPELNRHNGTWRAIWSFIFFVVGIGLMWGLKLLFE